MWHCGGPKQQSHLHQVCQKGDETELEGEDKDRGGVPAALVCISAQPTCEGPPTRRNHSTGNPNRRRARASFIPPRGSGGSQMPPGLLSMRGASSRMQKGGEGMNRSRWWPSHRASAAPTCAWAAKLPGLSGGTTAAQPGPHRHVAASAGKQ